MAMYTVRTFQVHHTRVILIFTIDVIDYYTFSLIN